MSRSERARIAALQTTVCELNEQNYQLKSMQLTGPLASIARIVQSSSVEWVNDAQLSTEPSGPYPDAADAIDDGLRAAAQQAGLEALSNLSPLEQLEVVRGSIDSETTERMLIAGFSTYAHRNPVGVLAALPEDSRRTVLSQLTDGYTLASIERLVRAEALIDTAVGPLQTEYDQYGHWSTDNLPIGSRVYLKADLVTKKGGSSSIECKGIVVDADNGPYIRATEDRPHPFKHPFILGVITDRSYGDFDAEITPGHRIDTQYCMPDGDQSFGTNNSRYLDNLKTFAVDGLAIQFDSPTRYLLDSDGTD